jgi:hypothetical protein
MVFLRPTHICTCTGLESGLNFRNGVFCGVLECLSVAFRRISTMARARNLTLVPIGSVKYIRTFRQRMSKNKISLQIRFRRVQKTVRHCDVAMKKPLTLLVLMKKCFLGIENRPTGSFGPLK